MHTPETAMKASGPDPWSRARWIAGGVVLLLLAVTAGASAWAQAFVRQEALAHFEHDVDEVRDALERETLVYVEALRGARGFVANSQLVTRGEWQGYVGMLDVEHRYEALRALSLNAFVTAAARARFEAEVRNDTSVDGPPASEFSIRPSDDRPYFVVVQFIAPLLGNEDAIGFDIGSQNTRREAVERAWTTGNPTATAPIQLVQNPNQRGLLILLPVYEPGTDLASEIERRRSLKFFVVAVVNLDQLVSQALSAVVEPIRLQILDEGATEVTSWPGRLAPDVPAEQARPIVFPSDAGSEVSRVDAGFHTLVDLEVAGRVWRISVEAEEAGPGVSAWAPRVIVALGVPLSLLGGAFVYLQSTSKARAEREARRLTARLSESESRRSLLMNNVAHELNGTLAPLHLQLHLLTSGRGLGAGGTLEESYAIMGRSVDNLKRLVNDLADAARMESGGLRLEPTRLDLPRLVREVAVEFRALARAKGVDLIVEGLAALDARADAHRTAQVLRNLLGNALKFTPSGGRIHVGVEMRDTGAEVSVTDTGRGVTSEEIGRLFQPFSQVRQPGETPVKGTGLGLYISKGLVEAMGGMMGCRSEGLGRGSTFWLTLPRADQPAD